MHRQPALADLTLGSWLGGALQWHLAAMWLLAANGLIYLVLSSVQRFAYLFVMLDIVLKCADNYDTSIDMPTKLGDKNPKHIQAISSPTPALAFTGKTRATTGSAGVECLQGSTLLQREAGFFSNRAIFLKTTLSHSSRKPK